MPDRTLDLFASAATAPGANPSSSQEPHVFSVTEVTRVVRGILETAFEDVWVEGEISNYRLQASGHQYFTLKDAECQLTCVRFSRPGMWRKNIGLQDGMQVQVRGRLTVYEARGQYQLNVSAIQPAGAGLLQARFEALKRKLAAEGLFDQDRKRPLPRFPRALGIVTSPSGAALRDILNVLERRSPWLHVVISPARVQGDGAAADVIAAIRAMEQVATLGLAPVDVIVIARGGGSMEDLWEFNHEELARVIASCSLPVVSAVGHEIDFTIADLVADLRAPTPSAAAELVAPDTTEVLRQLQQRAAFFHRHVTTTLAASARHLAGLVRSALFREPQSRIEQLIQQVDSAELALTHTMKDELGRRRQILADHAGQLRAHRPDQKLALMAHRVNGLATRTRETFLCQLQSRRENLKRITEMLRLLSPTSTLQRGYTLTTDAEGHLIRSMEDAPRGTTLITKLLDGEVMSVVQDGKEAKPSRRTERK